MEEYFDSKKTVEIEMKAASGLLHKSMIFAGARRKGRSDSHKG